MLYTIFLLTALIGGTVMVCQFLLTMLGMSDADGGIGDVDAGDFGDAGADMGDFDGAMDADVDGDHHTSIHHAADADIDHPASARLFQVLSFRAIVAALTFFGLGGLGALSKGYSATIALMVATLAGCAALYGMYKLMKAIYSFQSSGNVNLRNAVGRAAKIYVPVPASGDGKGKVLINVQGRTMELEAVTDEAERLVTGEDVVVERIIGDDVVKVARRLDSPVEV